MRANPANAQFMPEPVSYKEVKAEIKSARVLNNTVARLLRATRKGALDLTTVGEGGIATRYEVREFQIAKAVNERRKSLRRKKLGIDYGQTLGRMGTLQQNNLLPDKRTARQVFSDINYGARENDTAITDLLLSFVTCGIWGIFCFWKYSKKLYMIGAEDNSLINVLLAVFGFALYHAKQYQ